jgi:hypothetical protein
MTLAILLIIGAVPIGVMASALADAAMPAWGELLCYLAIAAACLMWLYGVGLLLAP